MNEDYWVEIPHEFNDSERIIMFGFGNKREQAMAFLQYEQPDQYAWWEGESKAVDADKLPNGIIISLPRADRFYVNQRIA